jgi:hypothetical protein
MPDFLDALDHCASIEWTRANSHIISVVVCTPSSYCNVFPALSGFVFSTSLILLPYGHLIEWDMHTTLIAVITCTGTRHSILSCFRPCFKGFLERESSGWLRLRAEIEFMEEGKVTALPVPEKRKVLVQKVAR